MKECYRLTRPLSKISGLRRKSAFYGNVFCDFDLSTLELEKLTISWLDCRKILCNFWFKSLQWFRMLWSSQDSIGDCPDL